MVGSGYFPLKSLGKEESGSPVWRVQWLVRSSSRSPWPRQVEWVAGHGAVGEPQR